MTIAVTPTVAVPRAPRNALPHVAQRRTFSRASSAFPATAGLPPRALLHARSQLRAPQVPGPRTQPGAAQSYFPVQLSPREVLTSQPDPAEHSPGLSQTAPDATQCTGTIHTHASAPSPSTSTHRRSSPAPSGHTSVQRRHVSLLATLGLVGLPAAALCDWGLAGARAEASEAEDSSLFQSFYELSAEEFQRVVIDQGSPCVVMFYAPWCPQCKRLAPQWAEMVRELERRGSPVIPALYNADTTAMAVPYVDRTGQPTTLHVAGYPTLALFRGGEVVKVSVGSKGRDRSYFRPDTGVSSLVKFASEGSELKLVT